MATSFEKVMNACLEAKKPATNTTAKRVVESKPVAKKKAMPKKSLTESNRARKSRRFYEEDDREELDVEFDTINDIPAIPDVDEIEFDEINEVEPVDDVMDDVVDDVVVVVDPEIDAEEIDSVATELQDIIDDTPDGEVPTTDEYVGNYTYGCPICGTTFFSETEMNDGDECPVCNNTPNGFVLVGQVVSTDEAEVADEVIDDVVDDLGDIEDAEYTDEPLEVDTPVEDEEEEEVTAEESYRRARANRMRREAMRRNNVRRPATRSNRARVESRRPTARRTPNMSVNSRARVEANRTRRPNSRGLMLDESTFNPYLSRFIRENYKNARSFTVRGAKLNRNSKTLRLECVITMRNGNKKRATIRLEGFVPGAKMVKGYDASRSFKCEGKTAPFTFKLNKVGNVIKCEGLRYNYTTKSLREGKKYQVTGNLIRESKAPVSRANRSAVNRRNIQKRYK